METPNNQFFIPNSQPLYFFPNSDSYFLSFQQMALFLNQQKSEIQQLKSENTHLKSLLAHYETHKTSIDSKSSEHPQIQIAEPNCKKQKPVKSFVCEYDNCGRIYASCLALNLHIKTKHNGGTKKQRDAYAKLIALSEIKGLPRPEIQLNFPRNYIERFKRRLLEEEKHIKN